MKALSIRQPWLWAILDIPENDCPKRVENRKGTAFNYRGPVLLHASSGGTRREFCEAVLAISVARKDHGTTSIIEAPKPADLPRGCFLGIARIVNVVLHPPAFVRGAPTSGYRIAGQLGLRLDDVRRLPPVNARGQLGLYNVAQASCLVRAGELVSGPQSPGFVDFGEHREVYATAWAELSAKGHQ